MPLLSMFFCFLLFSVKKQENEYETGKKLKEATNSQMPKPDTQHTRIPLSLPLPPSLKVINLVELLFFLINNLILTP